MLKPLTQPLWANRNEITLFTNKNVDEGTRFIVTLHLMISVNISIQNNLCFFLRDQLHNEFHITSTPLDSNYVLDPLYNIRLYSDEEIETAWSKYEL